MTGPLSKRLRTLHSLQQLKQFDGSKDDSEEKGSDKSESSPVAGASDESHPFVLPNRQPAAGNNNNHNNNSDDSDHGDQVRQPLKLTVSV